MKNEVKTQQENKYKGLDILKFLCAIIIACIYHYKNDFPVESYFDNFTILKIMANHGWLLVELFFIISGFFFFISYYDKIRNRKINIRNFMLKRYIRLIPLTAISAVTMFILQNIYNQTTGHYWMWGANDLVNLILQITGIQYWTQIVGCSLNNVTWYISVLILCYLLYYKLTQISAKRGNIIYLVPIILGIILYSYNLNLPLINYNILRGIIAFGIGIVLGIILKKKEQIKKISNISIIALILIIISLLLFKSEAIGDKLLFLDLIIYPILIINLIRFECVFTRINPKITNYLSNLSFGIYIWDLPVQLLIVLINQIGNLHINYATPSFFIIQILIHIGIAILSYELLEKRFLVKKIDRLFNK